MKKKLKPADSRIFRNRAIAQYYIKKTECIDAKLSNILLENENLKLKNCELRLKKEQIAVELDKVKLELEKLKKQE